MYLNGSCPFWYWSEDDLNGQSNNYGSERNRQGNETSPKDRCELNSTVVSPSPHLSSMIGLSSFSNIDLNEACRKYKIFETKVEDNHLVTRIYKDVQRFFSRGWGRFDTRIKKGRIIDQIFEEKFKNGSNIHDDMKSNLEYLNLRHGVYILEHTLSNGTKALNLHSYHELV